MKIPVLIEPISDRRFRASGAAWEMSAEGQTSEEALERLRQEVQQRLSHGGQVTFLDTEQLAPSNGSEHPLTRFAGCMKDEPLYDVWQAAVTEYRASCDWDGV